MVLTVFLPATGPQLLHSHFIITFPRLLRHRRGNLHFGSGDLLRSVDVSSDEGGSSSQSTAGPARLNVDPEVGWVRLTAVDDLPALGSSRHRVLPDPVLLAPSVVTFRHGIESVLRVSLPTGRSRAEPPGGGQPRVGAGVVEVSALVMSSSLLSAVERVLHVRSVQRVFGVVEAVVVVVPGVDLETGVCAGLVLAPLTVPVPVVGVVAVLVSPPALAVLHLVVGPRHVSLLAVLAPLEAIRHTSDPGRVEAVLTVTVIQMTSVGWP